MKSACPDSSTGSQAASDAPCASWNDEFEPWASSRMAEVRRIVRDDSSSVVHVLGTGGGGGGGGHRRAWQLECLRALWVGGLSDGGVCLYVGEPLPVEERLLESVFGDVQFARNASMATEARGLDCLAMALPPRHHLIRSAYGDLATLVRPGGMVLFLNVEQGDRSGDALDYFLNELTNGQVDARCHRVRRWRRLSFEILPSEA